VTSSSRVSAIYRAARTTELGQLVPPTPAPSPEVTFRIEFVPLTGTPIDLGSTAEGSKAALTRPLPAGLLGRVSLIVNAGTFSAADRVAWIEPRVVRLQ
jgi:hypothetical protein